MDLRKIRYGTATVKIISENPERFLNVAAKREIKVRNIKRTPDGLLLKVSVMDCGEIEKLTEKYDFFSATVMKERGITKAFGKVRKRYFLFAGIALCAAAIWVSSLFVWQIDVYGNEKVTSSEILAELENLGVGIGAYRYGISHEFVSNKMLLEIPELSWLTVNIRGSRAEVLVREETEPPELRNEQPASLYAAKEGIISKMTVINGSKTVEVGDAVMKGDLLVSGDMSDGIPDGLVVRADGEVLARTWYEMSAVMPLEAEEKAYTGEKKQRSALVLGGKRINLYFTGGNPWQTYDKITRYNTLTVSANTVLPITTVKEAYFEYAAVPKPRDTGSAERVLEARLLSKLTQMINGGSILSVDYVSKEKDGTLTVTIFAECEENIGIAGPVEQCKSNDISSGGL